MEHTMRKEGLVNLPLTGYTEDKRSKNLVDEFV